MDQEQCKALLETLYVSIEQRQCFDKRATSFVDNLMKTKHCDAFLPLPTATTLNRLRQDYQFAITPECINTLDTLDKREERIVVQTIAH